MTIIYKQKNISSMMFLWTCLNKTGLGIYRENLRLVCRTLSMFNQAFLPPYRNTGACMKWKGELASNRELGDLSRESS